jgi:ACS family sodium-dependent inorganic phosphate cotransporter
LLTLMAVCCLLCVCRVWGGQLSDKYGGSAVLAAGLAVWSLATVLTPLSAALGTWQLLTARVVLGMAQGIAFPAIHALLAKKVSCLVADPLTK